MKTLCPKRILAGLAVFTAGVYAYDVLWIPSQIAKKARAEANRLKGPLLNVGAGLPNSSFRAVLVGPTLWGDVNVDLAAPKDVPHGPDAVSYGDAMNLPFEDNTFAACVASHLLEHVSDPAKAVAEMQRVTYGNIFLTVPKWWAPHTYLHLGHRNYISQTGEATPLWPAQIAAKLPGRERSLVAAKLP